MSVLDRLYSLEIEFHRRFRAEAIDAVEAWNIHTSYALQHGYEPLLRTIGAITSTTLAWIIHGLLGERNAGNFQDPHFLVRHE
jgi:hypothetical protein